MVWLVVISQTGTLNLTLLLFWLAAGTEEQQRQQEEKREGEEEEDEAVLKARQWDDWKDTHPRGYGNRKNMG